MWSPIQKEDICVIPRDVLRGPLAHVRWFYKVLIKLDLLEVLVFTVFHCVIDVVILIQEHTE